MFSRLRLYSGDTFTVRGYTFRVTYERDDDMREPWKENDGHGIISDWTRRDKNPGERVLCEDRGSRRYYDVQETMKLAKKDGWGCSHSRYVDSIPNTTDKTKHHEHHVYWHGHTTQGAALACAVDEDFENLRAWCADEWEWTCVRVYLKGTREYETLGGIYGDRDPAPGQTHYLTDCAYELAEEILTRVEVDVPDIQLSEN